VDDQIAELIMSFMKRKLVRKTDRKFKKPKPGKKRLVKFPRTLVPHPVRVGLLGVWGLVPSENLGVTSATSQGRKLA
jgi:hypothetical protein